MKSNLPNPLWLMLFLIGAVIIFHLFILLGFIPYEITWGGRLKNDTEMYIFETFSIVLNLFLGWVILMKSKYLNFRFKARIINGILWFFLILFLVNTIGNLFAETGIEKAFSILTLIFAFLIWLVIKLEDKIAF